MKKLHSISAFILALSLSVSTMLHAQDTQEKKPMSGKAKGAIIGGATGAIGGAIINKKNRAAGAAVGGVVGAGVGFGVGAVIDNKAKKKAAEEAARQEEIARQEQLDQIAAQNAANTGSANSYASAPARTVKKATRRYVAPAAKPQEVQPAYMKQGWILNDGPADPMVAYSDSEFKRKSW